MKPSPLFFAPVGDVTTGGTGSGMPEHGGTPRNLAQAKRSVALKQALAAAREIVSELLTAQTHDLEKPLKQRDRHEFAARVCALNETIADKMETFEG